MSENETDIDILNKPKKWYEPEGILEVPEAQAVVFLGIFIFFMIFLSALFSV